VHVGGRHQQNTDIIKPSIGKNAAQVVLAVGADCADKNGKHAENKHHRHKPGVKRRQHVDDQVDEGRKISQHRHNRQISGHRQNRARNRVGKPKMKRRHA